MQGSSKGGAHLSTVQYTIKLQDEGHPLSTAYKMATDEFVKLRAKREMLQLASEYEARHYGATFGPNAIVCLQVPVRMTLMTRNDIS